MRVIVCKNEATARAMEAVFPDDRMAWPHLPYLRAWAVRDIVVMRDVDLDQDVHGSSLRQLLNARQQIFLNATMRVMTAHEHMAALKTARSPA